MKKIVRIPAKINLTLDITGIKGGYHELLSLVTSVNIFDKICAKNRTDDKVTVTFTGLPCGVAGENSHAKKAAELFIKSFGGRGADITVKRGIPAGAGLGGSSADAAGALLCLKELRRKELIGGGKTEKDIEAELVNIANLLGSDTAYMLKGGYAVLSGRGEKIERLAERKKFFYLIIAGKEGVSSSECYKRYDELGVKCASVTEKAARVLRCGDEKELAKLLKNDLYPAAAEILPEIGKNLSELSAYGAAAMTGSGSATFGVYKSVKKRNAAYKKLKSKYGKRLVKAKTVLSVK